MMQKPSFLEKSIRLGKIKGKRRARGTNTITVMGILLKIIMSQVAARKSLRNSVYVVAMNQD